MEVRPSCCCCRSTLQALSWSGYISVNYRDARRLWFFWSCCIRELSRSQPSLTNCVPPVVFFVTAAESRPREVEVPHCQSQHFGMVSGQPALGQVLPVRDCILPTRHMHTRHSTQAITACCVCALLQKTATQHLVNALPITFYRCYPAGHMFLNEAAFAFAHQHAAAPFPSLTQT